MTISHAYPSHTDPMSLTAINKTKVTQSSWCRSDLDYLKYVSQLSNQMTISLGILNSV